jgi:hypothetical protein
VNAVLPDPDESMERALFERRARALTAAGVPSLEAVLRAARSEPREAHGSVAATPAETSSARRRAWGLALAAACLLAVMKTHPGEITPPAIVADTRAEAPLAAGPGASVCEAPETSECAPETTCTASLAGAAPAVPVVPAVPVPPVTHDDGVCSAPRVTPSAATLSCDPDDAVCSQIH